MLGRPAIPRCPKGKSSEPTYTAVQRAASATGMSYDRAADAIEVFLDEVCNQIALGELVILPNFGSFFARARVPRGKLEPRAPYAVPGFRASRSLRKLLRMNQPRVRVHERRKRRYRRRSQRQKAQSDEQAEPQAIPERRPITKDFAQAFMRNCRPAEPPRFYHL